MKEFSVEIKPLTPIWTGNENGECETLRETGIIGSLRWWYEALIRGLGGYACDPTNTKCEGKNHCVACELFGCAGWARKFRLEVEFNNTIPKVQIGTRGKKGNKYLKRNIAGFMSDGTIVLKFTPLRKITPNEWKLLNKTLQVIAVYGALGAKTTQGNGVIEIVENNIPHKNENFKKSEVKVNGNKDELPNLSDFFFYKFHIKFKENISDLIDNEVFWTHQPDHNNFNDEWEKWKTLWNDYNFLPVAFHVRDTIRRLENDRNKRHELFGEIRKGSKIFVSHGYKINDKMIEIRIWGYDVKKSVKNGEEESIKNKIKKELGNKLKEKLFSKEEYKQHLERCILKDEKSGSQLLEGLE
jgi:CRISPR type III-B/RAMP module RAMP protein Cmr1